VKFLDPLELEYMDGRFWRVTQPFSYAVGSPGGKTVIEVPANFITDFASIPRVLWSLLPPTGFYGKAAVIHDFCYLYGRIGDMEISQKYSDDVLNEAMCVLAAEWVLTHGRSTPDFPQIPRGELRTLIEREIIYRGVRLFGFFTWRRYRKGASSYTA
jgi:uncharacterized protein DUF1353